MNGILLVNKEANMTSHDVVNRVRRILHTKKVGHTGTLDPNATGVLVLLIGNATKLLPFLENTDKVYVAGLELGYSTISEDIWMDKVEEKDVTPIDDLQAVLDTFKGKQLQVPPMISSIKLNGKKYYEYAREGIEIERPAREIEIYDIKAISEDEFRVHCSSGTYVRSICRDIALKTNNLGVLKSLVREQVGSFTLEMCSTLKEIEEGNYTLIPMERAVDHLVKIEVEDEFDVINGKHLRLDIKEDRCVMMKEGKILAIYDRHHANVFRCTRGFRE